MEKKEKVNYTYEYQEFIAINKIKVKKLPKDLRRRINSINEMEAAAKEDCTVAHYKYIKKLLTPTANEIIDDLYELFQEQIKNNKIVEVEEELTSKPDMAILEIMKKEERFYVKTKELYDLGVTISKFKRTIQVGKLQLRRGLTQDNWRVISDKKGKGGENE